MEDNIIYEFDGGVGDTLIVYEDRVIIKRKGLLNSFLMSASLSKPLFYSDMISVKVEKSGLTAAYLKFSLPNGIDYSNTRYGDGQNPNTVVFVDRMSDTAFEIEEYINNKIQNTKNNT